MDTPSLIRASVVIWNLSTIIMLMQSLKHTDQMKDIIRCLLDEIQDTQRQIFPDHAPTFNNSLKNKLRLMRQILWLTDRYSNMTVKHLLYLIECKIEGERFLLDFAKTIDATDEYFDNLDNLEWITFAVRKAGKVEWED